MKWGVAFIELLLLAVIVMSTIGILSAPGPLLLRVTFALLGTACALLIGYFIFDIVRD